MCPADFREALYSTWMTGRPWGMKLIDCDSDGDNISYNSTDEVHCIQWHSYIGIASDVHQVSSS